MYQLSATAPPLSAGLRGRVRSGYALEDIRQLHKALDVMGVFRFDRFATGLFPAMGRSGPAARTSGYFAAWVRDNVHIAYAHHVGGDTAAAVGCVRAIADFYHRNRRWFTEIIEGRVSPMDPMARPHIRFNGETGAPIAEKWPHAQNDAIGAFLWLFCLLVQERAFELTASDAALLADVVRYLEAIAFWRDEDSGHWEEQRKRGASSIGAVNAGLRQYRSMTASLGTGAAAHLSLPQIDQLLEVGLNAMNAILPYECRQSHPRKNRRYDAALLFLVEPFDIVSKGTAYCIIDDVVDNLQGVHGIRRYPMDSYWGPDYRSIPPEKRTIDLSDDIILRDDFAVAGKEAEWCIFDSILSIYWGKQFLARRDPADLKKQHRYLNRALCQLVEAPSGGGMALPEAFFVENGRYVPNDHVPLQWATANLWRALEQGAASLAVEARTDAPREAGRRS